MVSLTEKGEFAIALASYNENCDTWYDIVELLHKAQALQLMVESDVEYRAAEVRLSHIFVGKNAEERAAEMAVALKQDSAYEELWKQAEGLRQAVANQQANAAMTRDRTSGHKRQMDFIIAWTRFLAKEGGESDDE